MTNEELLDRRWTKTDQLLRQFKRAIKPLTKDVRNQILDVFESVDIPFSDLNKRITAREESRLNRSIREWEEMGLNNDYLNYKIKTRGRNITYATLLMILLLGIYAVYMKRVYEESKSLFIGVGRDAVKQAEKEMGRPPKRPFSLTWELIESFLIVQTLQLTLYAYLQLLTQQNAEEAYKIYLQSKQVSKGAEISLLGLDTLIIKQENRLINIHDGKESGVITDTTREAWNELYIEPYRKENPQCRFIAERDDKTTKMCKGLDNMLFYTDDWNRYYRYSDLDKRDVLYTTYGLKVGENLPPINNHFHWCRSTITYLLDEETAEDIRSKLGRRPSLEEIEKTTL